MQRPWKSDQAGRWMTGLLLLATLGCASPMQRPVTPTGHLGSPATSPDAAPRTQPQRSLPQPGEPIKPDSPFLNGAAPGSVDPQPIEARGRPGHGALPTAPAGLPAVQKNIRVNPPDGVRAQNETSIAVNKTNPLNVVGVSHDRGPGDLAVGWNTSFDGGLTWTGGTIDDDTNGFEADPVITSCPDGTFVLVLLSVSPGSAMFTYRSTDGGLTWTKKIFYENPAAGGLRVDKPEMTCDDTGSPYHGRLYLEWMQLETLGDQQMMMAASINSGLSWNREVEFADTTAAQNQGAVAVGPGGEVYVVWAKRDANDNVFQMFDRSLDGGRTFGTDQTLVQVSSIPLDGAVFRNSHASIEVDGTSDRFAGNIYISWSDNRNGHPDILLIRSTDGGATWSEPIVVNDDQTFGDQWHAWMSVDPDGNLFLTWWDRRRTTGREYEIWGAASYDGGVTFDRNFVISDAPSDASLDTFFGDYTGLDTSNEFLYPLWVDTREGVYGDTDLYTDRYPNLFDYNVVTGLQWLDRETLTFDEQDTVFGHDVGHDVLGGRLGELRVDRGFDRAVCDAPAWSDAPFVDARVPPQGDGFYYLIRAHGPRGVGTYGDAAPVVRNNARDPLDETFPICP